VADNGTQAQQGFGSAEPYIYKNEVAEWGKDVAYQYLSDAGWDAYAATVGTRAADVEKLSPCLKLLVPVIQRAQRDYIKDPAETNALIIEAVGKYNTGWVYTEGVAAYSVETQLKDSLVANSPDGTLGSFDTARVDAFIGKALPIYKAEGGKVKDPLTAADLVTNEFIDPSVAL
jgi:ABC-type nitrate/sulfonate/bicarbonate transport system substrate-binding protein